MQYDVLIIDDEVALGQATEEYFNAFGVKTTFAASGAQAFEFLKSNRVSLILLDINLENENGFDLCKRLRKETDIPIFFISARLNENDMLIALNVGGDDYITKPYVLSVLLAKIKVRLKREDEKGSLESLTVIDNLIIDFAKMKAYLSNKDLELKPKEFKLLAYFVINKNKVVTKDEILQNVWGDTYISDGALNIQIFRLREKIEPNPDAPKYIKTVWGQGYMFESR